MRIRVKTPENKPAEWFDQVVIVGKKPVAIYLPIAYNDFVGTWKINAIDLYTNEATITNLTVK